MLILPTNPKVKEPVEWVIGLIEKDFNVPDLKDRITVIADVNHFRVMEDKSVWEQARGRRPNYYEVYFDGVWISDFDDNTTAKMARLNYLKGFMKAYEEGKIHLNTQQELTNHEVETAVDKAMKKVDAMTVTSEEDAIVKETLTDLVKEKKKKKKLSDFNI